mmetsp:Transcript_107290/g.185112  ORF Transcript_107290/g.185112 Transcript_107290/m.185112 type:complete len:126 (+) Transcript_107290:689-1066(+)
MVSQALPEHAHALPKPTQQKFCVRLYFEHQTSEHVFVHALVCVLIISVGLVGLEAGGYKTSNENGTLVILQVQVCPVISKSVTRLQCRPYCWRDAGTVMIVPIAGRVHGKTTAALAVFRWACAQH